MKEDLKLHIKKMQRRAILSLLAIILLILNCVGTLFLFIPSAIGFIFLAIAVLCGVYLLYIKHIEKKEDIQNPFVIDYGRELSFENICEAFESLTDKKNCLSLSEDLRFLRVEKDYKLRIILYKTVNFDKNEFDISKKRINKKANEVFNISQWVSRLEANKMMRLNIIYADTPNEELFDFISKNANHNLTRSEGVMNIAIVGNRIFISPLYGYCYLREIMRYKGVVNFIDRTIF